MLFTDIETVPNESLTDLLPEIKPPGNYKKPESMAKWMAQHGEVARQQQVAKMALDPLLFRLRAIALANSVEAEPEIMVIRNESEEKAALQEFWRRLSIRSWETLPVIGYNVIDFDLLRLMWRSMVLEIKPGRTIDLSRYGKEVLDLYLILKNHNPRLTSMVGMGLKPVCALLDIPNPLPDVDGSMVATMDDEELLMYAGNDIHLLQQLYLRMEGVYFPGRETF